MKKSTINFIAFVALFIVAVLILVNNILPLVGITIGGMLFTVLETVKDVLFLVIVGVSAYSFVANKTKAWKIIFAVIFVIFVVGIILRFVL